MWPLPCRVLEKLHMSKHSTTSGFRLADYFDRILDLFGDGIYMTDREGRTLKVNRPYENLTGLKRGELIGRRVTDLRSAGVFDTALNPEVVRTGRPKTSVQIVRNGRRVVLNAFPVFGETGRVALVVTFVRDVTAMTQLKAQLAEQGKLISEFDRKLQRILGDRVKTPPLIAESPRFRETLNRMRKIAGTDVAVLLLGETGVGKGVMARQIHSGSPRSRKPFLVVDCAGIPHSLIESELFGYTPGAFSGASPEGKIGYFEMADKGTLLLDEIGELTLPMQAKLLRVLQEYEIVRVGDTRPRKIDVRIVAATHRDLAREVAAGRFRKDLFYRLQVAVIDIPGLNERKPDIVPLARHFADRFSHRHHKRVSLTREAEAVLVDYHWPGNVRELENLIQGLVVTSENGAIGRDDLPRRMLFKGPAASFPHACRDRSAGEMSLKKIMAGVERDLILDAMDACGSVAKVAERFQVDRTTIFRKVRKYRSADKTGSSE